MPENLWTLSVTFLNGFDSNESIDAYKFCYISELCIEIQVKRYA